MVKVRGPMFTITASGTVGDAIEFVRWIKDPFRQEKDRSGMAYVRGRVLPLKPMTNAVVAIRGTLGAGVSTWHLASMWWVSGPSALFFWGGEYRNSWDSVASGTGMSGFNRYAQKFIENNPQRQSPWFLPYPS